MLYGRPDSSAGLFLPDGSEQPCTTWSNVRTCLEEEFAKIATQIQRDLRADLARFLDTWEDRKTSRPSLAYHPLRSEQNHQRAGEAMSWEKSSSTREAASLPSAACPPEHVWMNRAPETFSASKVARVAPSPMIANFSAKRRERRERTVDSKASAATQLSTGCTSSPSDADVKLPFARRSDLRYPTASLFAHSVDKAPSNGSWWTTRTPAPFFLGLPLQMILEHRYFDYGIGLLILLNALLMGVQADFAASCMRTGSVEPVELQICSSVFCFIFTVELVLKTIVYRLRFFTMPSWRWNVFELIIVSLQLWEEVAGFVVWVRQESVGEDPKTAQFTFMRVLRALRLVRIIRVARVLQVIRELRTMVSSISSTVLALFWTMVLLLLVLYVFSIFCVQLVNDSGAGDLAAISEGTEAHDFFGSIDRSLLVLYQAMTGGIDWKDASDVLVDRGSPIMGLVFSLYVFFAVLALTNVITGVFVEAALATAKKESSADLVDRLRDLVAQLDSDDLDTMTWEQFEGLLTKSPMESYFKSVDLNMSEAQSLFKLLDIEETGIIKKEQFVMGCLRIHGPAKAMDLITLMSEMRRMQRQWHSHALFVEEAITLLLSWKSESSAPRGGRHVKDSLQLYDAKLLPSNRQEDTQDQPNDCQRSQPPIPASRVVSWATSTEGHILSL